MVDLCCMAAIEGRSGSFYLMSEKKQIDRNHTQEEIGLECIVPDIQGVCHSYPVKFKL
jgi:hypothetical protein